MKAFLAALLVMLLGVNAHAQQWPTRPIELIIPFTAGGGVDTTGRRVARAMADHLGQTIVVANRDGASGSIGFAALATSAPDGYTLGGGPSTPIANAIHLIKAVKYTPESFDYICRTFDNVFVIAVPNDSKYKTAKDLFGAAKSEPDKIVFGHAGVSSNSHLSVENLAKGLSVKLRAVPFRGDSAILPVLLSGDLDFGALSLIAVRDQPLRVLLVFADERVPLFPDVPTAKEMGVTHVPTLNGIYAPKGLPEPIRASLENACAIALRDEDVRKFITNGGQVPNYQPGDKFKQAVAEDFAVKGELIRSIGLEAK